GGSDLPHVHRACRKRSGLPQRWSLETRGPVRRARGPEQRLSHGWRDGPPPCSARRFNHGGRAVRRGPGESRENERLEVEDSYFDLLLCSGFPLRLVEAIFLSSFPLIESYMLLEAPRSELLGFSCSLTASAIPAADCCAL